MGDPQREPTEPTEVLRVSVKVDGLSYPNGAGQHQLLAEQEGTRPMHRIARSAKIRSQLLRP